ncbi:DUF4829 domain-containing protein [Clostridium sp.]|uniref:DUF4829 domain-containing protein n=1 Tax=Clostridium sp. TaxID=1506 RepID=UPI003F3AD2DA
MKAKKYIWLLTISCMFIFIGCSNLKTDSKQLDEDEYIVEFENGKRLFKSEVYPKSDTERVILDNFKIYISDEYEKFKYLYADIDVFKDQENVYKNNFNQGLYTNEIVIHSLKKLDEIDYSGDENKNTFYPYMDKLNSYNPSEFEIIEVNYTKKLTNKYDKVAQWGNGNWTRYYVLIKEDSSSIWKIFDVYGHMVSNQ